MRIEHVAVWTKDFERLRAFYEKHLGGWAGPRYDGARGFSSYSLHFPSSARLELMQLPALAEPPVDQAPLRADIAHLAFEVGAEADVDALTGLGAAGYRVVGLPRRIGDGYYEGVVLDPDGNVVEFMAASGVRP
jgi:lactoylglutathione lyase